MMTPSDNRSDRVGRSVRFATHRTELGLLLVAATERGVCAIKLGDDGRDLARELREEYPHATLRPAEGRFQAWLETVEATLDGPVRSLDLPLDLMKATSSQMRVWEALCDIPYGSTRSYGEVAESIGQPNAARAVASACASNRLALVIPCHRVVRSDGAIGGYRWNVERKRRLLQMESERSERVIAQPAS